jgi:hypothetical protein
LSPAALVVINQLAIASEGVETGEEIIVVGAGATVENDSRWTAADAALEDADTAYLASTSLRYGSFHLLIPSAARDLPDIMRRIKIRGVSPAHPLPVSRQPLPLP